MRGHREAGGSWKFPTSLGFGGWVFAFDQRFSPYARSILTISRSMQSTKGKTRRQLFADFERSELTVAWFRHSIGCSTPTFDDAQEFRWPLRHHQE